MRLGHLGIPLLFLACAHPKAVEPNPIAPTAPSEAPRPVVAAEQGEPPLTIVPVIEGGSGTLKIELLAPSKKSTWLCSSTAKAGDNTGFQCAEPHGWYRGPGEYQVDVEYRSGGGTYLQTFDAFEADPEDTREVLEIAVRGAGSQLITVGYKRARKAPEVEVGDVDASVFGLTTSAGISKTAVAKELARHKTEVWKCYEAELARSPGLEMTVTADFRVRSDGTVADASGAGPATNPGLLTCVLGKLRGWKFPKPSGGVATVSYPWKFKPKQ
jgi:hypothetical protein